MISSYPGQGSDIKCKFSLVLDRQAGDVLNGFGSTVFCLFLIACSTLGSKVFVALVHTRPNMLLCYFAGCSSSTSMPNSRVCYVYDLISQRVLNNYLFAPNKGLCQATISDCSVWISSLSKSLARPFTSKQKKRQGPITALSLSCLIIVYQIVVGLQ